MALIIIMLFLFSAFGAAAEDKESQWKDINMKIAAAMEQGNLEAAVAAALESLDFAKKEFGAADVHAARAMNNLANLYLYQNKMDEAESLYREAIAIEETILGRDGLEVADTLFNLAMVAAMRKQYQEADSLLTSALKIKEQKLGADHPDLERIYAAKYEIQKDSQAAVKREI